MKYLVQTVDTYRVDTLDEAKHLQTELENDNHFSLVDFHWTNKLIKHKDADPEEYLLVSAKKVFNDVKYPENVVDINYSIGR